jgi:hypothetical protein
VESFTHTDDDGDGVVIDSPVFGGLRIKTLEDPVVLLDQDAVNRLAQYLDRHRTDQQFNEAREALPEPVNCPWRYRRLSGRVDVCDRGNHEGSDHGLGEIKWYESATRAFKAIPDKTLGSVVLGNCVPPMRKCGVCGHGSHGTDRCTADAANGSLTVLCHCEGRAEDYRADPSAHVDFNAFYCAGYRTRLENPGAGCTHPRDQHGALGCNAGSRAGGTQCPCERRNGS